MANTNTKARVQCPVGKAPTCPACGRREALFLTRFRTQVQPTPDIVEELWTWKDHLVCKDCGHTVLYELVELVFPE